MTDFCPTCGGSGRTTCMSCGGSGRRFGASNTPGGQTCMSCGGSGRQTCLFCHGSGRTSFGGSSGRSNEYRSGGNVGVLGIIALAIFLVIFLFVAYIIISNILMHL